MNIYARILMEEARRRGIDVKVMDDAFNIYYLTYQGEMIKCWESLTEKTSAFALTICQNKYLTHKYLLQAGLNTPRQTLWEGEERALQFMQKCNGKLVVKPLNGEQGKGITVGVDTTEKLLTAVEEARYIDPAVVLEEYVPGRDLRVIVIDYKFVAAIERIPAQVVGDGESTVAILIETKNEQLQENTGGESRIPVNEGTEHLLKEQGLTLKSIVPHGQVAAVCRLANFHSGGTIEDVTSQISPVLKNVSEKAARTIGIPVVGLDLLVPDFCGERYVIIEANERPGLANHEPQPTAERFIDFLFPKSAERGA